MSTFKQKQAKYSRKIHGAIKSVGNERWAAIRDTAIEIVAGVAAMAELATEMLGHFRFVRTATGRA